MDEESELVDQMLAWLYQHFGQKTKDQFKEIQEEKKDATTDAIRL